jgi:hypothetical protein
VRELIAKRLEQGLTLQVISTRLNIPISTVSLIAADIRRSKTMTVTERIDKIRGLVRPKSMKELGVRSGMQTHDAQDVQRLICEELDALEAQLGKEEEDGGKRKR